MIQDLNPDSGSAKLKDRMRRATRAAILDAAERVYAEHGLEGGRMEQVAEAAGVSVGTLYNYFGDRKELVKSLLEDRRAELLRRVDDALEAAPASATERLRVLLRSALEHFERHRAFVSLLFQDGVGECGSRLLAESTRPSASFHGLRDRARAALATAAERGELRDPDVDYLAHVLAGALRATVLHGLAEGRALEPAAAADRILRLFLEGAGGSCRP